MKHILTLLVVLMMLTTPVLAAGEKLAYNGTVEDFATYDKVPTEKKKEAVALSKSIEKAPAELKGTISVKDVDVSKYEIKSTENGISIKAELDQKDHTRELTVTRAALEKIKGFNGERFYAHHFLDDGSYNGYQEVHIGKSSQVTFTVQFSEVLLSSFSGYYEVTQTLQSGQSITIPAGAERVDVSVSGEVPEHVVWDKNNISTYPTVPLYAFGMNNSTELTQSLVFNNVNVLFNGGVADFASARLWRGVTPAAYSSTTVVFRAKFNVNTQQAIIDMRDGTGGTGLLQTINTAKVDGSDTLTTISNSADGQYHLFAAPFPSIDIRRITIGSNYVGNFPMNGSIDYFMLYNGTVPVNDINTFMWGFSGIQLANQPYTGGTQTLNLTGNEVTYVATDGIAREVTARAFFTEDTTLISNTVSDTHQNISITHKAGRYYDNGTITYTCYNLYDGTPTLESNNTNATVSKSGHNILITAGMLQASETFYYNVSIPKEESNMVNPPFTGTTGIFVAIAGTFAAGVGYFANRRRK